MEHKALSYRNNCRRYQAGKYSWMRRGETIKMTPTPSQSALIRHSPARSQPPTREPRTSIAMRYCYIYAGYLHVTRSIQQIRRRISRGSYLPHESSEAISALSALTRIHSSHASGLLHRQHDQHPFVSNGATGEHRLPLPISHSRQPKVKERIDIYPCYVNSHGKNNKLGKIILLNSWGEHSGGTP